LKKRLKVPAAINHFTKTLGGNEAKELFKLLRHYRPESSVEKRKRLTEKAEAQLKDEKDGKKAKDDKKAVKEKKPMFLKYGLSHVTNLITVKKAKLVVIAHDVDPIELVVWLPALCRKMGIPYVIVKGKARLGHLVYQKTASAIALCEVRKEHETALSNLTQSALIQYNNSLPERGGGIMGAKFLARKKN